MTPKEKAENLIKQFLPFVDWNDLQEDCTNRKWAFRNAKKCALIAVDEISKLYYHLTTDYKYWQEVKQEIEKY